MTKCSPADFSKITLPDLDSIAKDSGLITRNSSKFSASKFLQSLLCAVVTGKGSLTEIAAGMGQRVGKFLSKQAMGARFSDASTSFLTRVAFDLIDGSAKGASSGLDSRIFKRILIEDSSFCPIAGSNAGTFPAHGNGLVETAGVKVDLVYDLGTAAMHSLTLHRATEQDKSIGKDLVDKVLPGDLVLRDMGYCVISEFARIERVGACWLSRLPVHTKVKTSGGRSLESILENSRGHSMELDVKVSNAEHQCRLVAVRADEVVRRQRRNERKKKAGSKTVVGSTGWIRDGWHLLLTNIERGAATTETLMAVYRMRWDIEIQFRGWKQSMKLRKALDRKSSEPHLMALILAAMIHQILGMQFQSHYRTTMETAALSIEKLCNLLAQFHLRMTRFEDVLQFEPDHRHIKKDRRKRLIPVGIGLAALS